MNTENPSAHAPLHRLVGRLFFLVSYAIEGGTFGQCSIDVDAESYDPDGFITAVRKHVFDNYVHHNRFVILALCHLPPSPNAKISGPAKQP
jgi:hypothetical protein